jgi:hypothetical protein
MPASIFVSHVYEDFAARDNLISWAKYGLLGPGVVIIGESADVRHQGNGGIQRHLSPKLQGASAVIVLVGNDTHNHRWIEYEAQHARSNRKSVIAVRIPNTTGAAPTVIAGLPLVAMDPTAIRAALGT